MTWRYDLIPDRYFRKSILDVGTGHSNNQIKSKNKEKFLQADYTGIEIQLPLNNGLKIIQADFFDWVHTNTQTFDILLVFEFIEHIPFRDWPNMFDHFKSLLNPNGELFITTPFKERISGYKKWILSESLPYYQKHVVFNITPRIIRWFLPHAHIRKQRYYYFKEHHERLLHAIGRYFKRVLTRHKFISKGIFPRSYKSLVITWRKENGNLLV